MKAKLELDIAPLSHQSYVHFGPTPEQPHVSLHVKHLSARTLEDLCTDFTNGMFEIAELKRPTVELQAVPGTEPVKLDLHWIDYRLYANDECVAEVVGFDSDNQSIKVISDLRLSPVVSSTCYSSIDRARRAAEKAVLQWFKDRTGVDYV
ncbi:MAG: hypothetical protein GY774_04840 [Planctomycetes bacterium]|nr:hypothetical protein [Planctomycetota bacterium]